MSAASAQATATTILLLDDDSRLRSSRATLLSDHGYAVQCAATAADAELHCRDSAPDLVLVGLSGRAAATFFLDRQVRAANPGQRIGFLMHEDHSLCAVLFNGETILPQAGPDDLVGRVATLLREP